MALLLDAGILYAYYDKRDAWHAASLELFRAEQGGLVVPAPVIVEVDYLLGKRLGREARMMFYRGLTEGNYFVVDLVGEGYKRVFELNRQYADLELGFVDAAVVAIAETLSLSRVATTDRRHFGALKAGLELLP